MALAAALLILLAGCLISSGEKTTIDRGQGIGSISVEFTTSDSLEGMSERTLEVASAQTLVSVTASATVESGLLKLEILDDSDAVKISINAKAQDDQMVTRIVKTDDKGRVHYRVQTNEARKGFYRIIYHLPLPSTTSTPGR